MRDPLKAKRVRPTMFSLFWLLFIFWLVALYRGLGGGLTTYSLLLMAIVVFVKATRTGKHAKSSCPPGDSVPGS
jgi:hypothetical protein